jgi:hypothetical protein
MLPSATLSKEPALQDGLNLAYGYINDDKWSRLRLIVTSVIDQPVRDLSDGALR